MDVPSGNYWIVEFKLNETSSRWHVADGKWHIAWRPANDRAKQLRDDGRQVRLVRLTCDKQYHEIV